LDIVTLLVTSVGLSMDAFAMALCSGMSIDKYLGRKAFKVAFFFGLFQGMMPLIGYLAGLSVESYIKDYDHFIAFGLLVFIGGRMILEAFKDDGASCCEEMLSTGRLTITAIATSIDALAVGISMAAIGADIWVCAPVIAAVTFVICFVGVCMGKSLGSKLGKHASIIGGVTLCLIGVKILLEHIGVL